MEDTGHVTKMLISDWSRDPAAPRTGATWTTSGERHQYLVAPKGRVKINGHEAQPRDGIAVTGETEIVVEALEDAEIVLVDAR